MIGESGPRFYIGTSGYSYPGPPPEGWSGVFYPKGGSKPADDLEFYATFFSLAEINTTFYHPPSDAMARSWLRRTPAVANALMLQGILFQDNPALAPQSMIEAFPDLEQFCEPW
ncbi:MAG: DUF72 domain-containing protein [Candidatus Binatia bacterium]